MVAARTSSEPTEITPAQRRGKIIAILATGLVRLIPAGPAGRHDPAYLASDGPGDPLRPVGFEDPGGE